MKWVILMLAKDLSLGYTTWFILDLEASRSNIKKAMNSKADYKLSAIPDARVEIALL